MTGEPEQESNPLDSDLGRNTLLEIVSQPDAWSSAYAHLQTQAQTIRRAWNEAQPRRILLTGCGSTYYLAQSAAALLQGLTGVDAQGVPASELALLPEQRLANPAETLLIAISRSGTTTETAAAMDQFRRQGGRRIWGVTCYPDTPVHNETDLALLTDMAQERSVAQTRSFSTMLLMLQGVAALAAGESLEPLGHLSAAGLRLIENTYGLAAQWGATAGLDKLFFLGSGALYGIACEAMLKMKEMSITHSEAYHFLEFRHGPKALIDSQALVVGLMAPRTRVHEEAVINEMITMDATTMTMLPGAETAGHVTVHLPDSLPPWAMPVLYLPVLQSMAHGRAVHKELDPDQPRNLSAVVHLDRDSLR